MNWTNGEIPDLYSTENQLRLIVHEQKSKIDWLNAQIERIMREFENVPRAVKEFGHIELKYDNERIVLIERPADEEREK